MGSGREGRVARVLLPAACVVAAAMVVAVLRCSQEPARPRPPDDLAALNRLLDRMHKRLALAEEVARHKWNARRPVHDPQREEAVLRAAVAAGERHGLPPEYTRAFFAAQLAASRHVQEACHARWRAAGQGPFPDVPELDTLRARLDELTDELLAALAAARPTLERPAAQRALVKRASRVLAGGAVDERARRLALEPLLSTGK